MRHPQRCVFVEVIVVYLERKKVNHPPYVDTSQRIPLPGTANTSPPARCLASRGAPPGFRDKQAALLGDSVTRMGQKCVPPLADATLSRTSDPRCFVPRLELLDCIDRHLLRTGNNQNEPSARRCSSLSQPQEMDRLQGPFTQSGPLYKLDPKPACVGGCGGQKKKGLWMPVWLVSTNSICF